MRNIYSQNYIGNRWTSKLDDWIKAVGIKEVKVKINIFF